MLYYALAGAIVYTMYGALAYMTEWKDNWWFIPVGLLLSVFGNFLWLIYVRSETNTSVILTNGAIWDMMVSVCFIISIIFTGKAMQLNTYTIVGGAVGLLGLIIMKAGL